MNHIGFRLLTGKQMKGDPVVPSRCISGLKTMVASVAVALVSAGLSWSQDSTLDGALGDQLQLELSQLRSEVDFLRTQVETGGGVADVRLDDLQRRIDKVLEDAAALATEASTAKRRAEVAVNRVAALEEQLAVTQAGVDLLATRLARLEADAVFQTEAANGSNDELAGEPVTPAVETTDVSGSDEESTTSVTDVDGVSVPLPKDRAETTPPPREVTEDVKVPDADAEVIALPVLSSTPGLVAVEGATPAIGGVPILPLRRPESPERASVPSQATREAVAEPASNPEPTGTFAALNPEGATASGRSSNRIGGFEESRDAFELGNFAEVITNLQALLDEGNLGTRAPEGYFMLGVAYQQQQMYPAAIQTLALGLRQYPNSEFAGPSLVNLADALDANGQTAEGCRLLSFVPSEYPRDTQAVANAEARMVRFGC